MTTPNDPQRDGGDQRPEPGRYEPTNHPEDRPDFGVPSYPTHSDSSAGTGAEFNGYSGYEGAGEYGVNGATIPAPPGVHPWEAIKFGFKRTFQNPGLWVLGSLLFIGVAVVVGLIAGFAAGWTGDANAEVHIGASPWGPGDIALNSLAAIIGLLLTPVIYSLVLRDIDAPKAGFKDIPRTQNFWKVIGASILVGIISAALALALAFITLFGALQRLEQSIEQLDDPAVALAALGTVLLAVLGLTVLMAFVTPFFTLIVWLVADGRAGVLESIPMGVKLGAKNYLPLVGFQLLLMFIMLVLGLVTLGFGLLVLLPAQYLALGHVYRQAIGGQIPAPAA
ncbi:hypothetical protein G7Y31_07080 [Corynebacterium lizhenjunii]|uniref:Integral membrane protein n=1 Tax=Corynebacterium lizhenjunii TaxID=2709394 RepID=A0A7T0KDF7_9CORY|nr:hypothetical protein [Corynebacterium lizhenjunii]QPK78341.1 hypothetical protein G7Y31_07080 [Corynebacterium lizhenjunii]